MKRKPIIKVVKDSIDEKILKDFYDDSIQFKYVDDMPKEKIEGIATHSRDFSHELVAI